jgi:hypothetical protein
MEESVILPCLFNQNMKGDVMMSGISGVGGMMGGMRPNPQQMFNRMDGDGNGGIDQNELSAITEKMAEQSGIEIDVASVMEEFDSDQDGLLSQEESQSAMESLHEQVGPPPPPPMGGMEGPMKTGAMSNQAVSEAYSQNDDDQSAINALIESLSETDDEAEKSGIVQEWLQTLMGNNQSYSPVDLRI